MWQGRVIWCGFGRWRRRKQRMINFIPNINVFKPAGVPISKLEQIEIGNDELEALRLKNIEWLDIIQWAEKMWISKSTFARIYNEAIKKLTNALIDGKAIILKKD